MSSIPLLLRAPILVDCKIIRAIRNLYKQEATATDPIGRSALHVAFEHPRMPIQVSAWHDQDKKVVFAHDECEIVRALLDWGVPIGVRDIFGRTALHLACFNNWSVDVV